jgi:hypothetical protein
MVGLLSLIAVILPPVLKNCGTAATIFKINSMSLEPANPAPGELVTMNLDYTVPEGFVVNDGEAKYAINYNFLPLAPTIEPLCQNIPCPLGPGTYANKTSSTWPSGVSGSVNTKITWTDETGTQLLCIDMAAKF